MTLRSGLPSFPDDAEGVFALTFEGENDLSNYAPTILLSRSQPTVAFSSTAFGDTDELESEIEADLESLDDELSALAEEEAQSGKVAIKSKTTSEMKKNDD